MKLKYCYIKNWKEKKKGKNTARNKALALHKDMPDRLIVQFTTPNKTSSRSCFESPLRKREPGHAEMSRHFISALSNEKALAPKTLRIITMKLGNILSRH